MADTANSAVYDNGTAPHASLNEALAAFQTELPKLVKDEKAKVKGTTKDGRDYDRSYGYADLAQVCETVLPVLGKHGLSIISRTAFIDNRFTLEVSLLHESGEREIAYWPLPDPMRVGPQDLGSAMTYGRRYLTLALTGTFPSGEDDDGAKAQHSARERWEDSRPQRGQKQERPVSAAPAPPKRDWSKADDAEVGGFHRKIETLEPISDAVQLYDWMANWNLHNRPIALTGTVNPDNGQPFEVNATEVLAIRLAEDAVKPEATAPMIDGLREIATERGLLKLAVSEGTTLDEELAMARDLLNEQLQS
jgi:ERF superfamily